MTKAYVYLLFSAGLFQSH